MAGQGDELGSEAKRLRRAGLTIREIKAQLGVTSDRLMGELLRGEPPNPVVYAGRAKREVQEQARALREQGLSYNVIAAELGVAKSSVSVWCRDVVLTDEQREALLLPSAEARLKRAESARAARIRRTAVIHDAAIAEVGSMSDRELFLVGVALYWAEGAKTKPWSPSTQVRFINSDPTVIAVYLAWLKLLGLPLQDLTLTVAIHERADTSSAVAFWADVARVDPSEIRLQLKRHNPKPRRHNVQELYRGGLVVAVRRSTDLNRRIEGWWRGIAAATTE